VEVRERKRRRRRRKKGRKKRMRRRKRRRMLHRLEPVAAVVVAPTASHTLSPSPRKYDLAFCCSRYPHPVERSPSSSATHGWCLPPLHRCPLPPQIHRQSMK
jgi:hypothetical protein